MRSLGKVWVIASQHVRSPGLAGAQGPHRAGGRAGRDQERASIAVCAQLYRGCQPLAHLLHGARRRPPLPPRRRPHACCGTDRGRACSDASVPGCCQSVRPAIRDALRGWPQSILQHCKLIHCAVGARTPGSAAHEARRARAPLRSLCGAWASRRTSRWSCSGRRRSRWPPRSRTRSRRGTCRRPSSTASTSSSWSSTGCASTTAWCAGLG